MIVKNLKTVAMFSVLATLAGSVMVFEQGHADNPAGRTIVREMQVGEPGADHLNMNRLQKIMTSETAADAEKQNALTQMQQIKERTANIIPNLTPEKQSKIRSSIDLLGDKIWELKTRGTVIPIVSIGTDYENETIRIGILHTELDEQKIQAYEDTIRQILGSETDMTIEPKGQIFFDTCSQTEDCELIKAGVKIMVQDSAADCSMGFKASHNGRTGFVTAGHCSSIDVGGTRERVGNPASSISVGLNPARTS